MNDTEYNDYRSFEIRANAEYKGIVSLSFTPVAEVPMTRKYKKGDWRFWKWLGIIPLIPYKIRKDLYKSSRWHGLMSVEKAKGEGWNWFIDNGKLFVMGEVRISYTNGDTKYKRFESNEKAIKYIDDIKKRCIEVGNVLK